MYDMTQMELEEVGGGNPLVMAGMLITGYIGLLDKMEKNPSSYTWMMDWYYE